MFRQRLSICQDIVPNLGEEKQIMDRMPEKIWISCSDTIACVVHCEESVIGDDRLHFFGEQQPRI